MFPNTSMMRGLLSVTAEAFHTRWCFVVTHLESPMWTAYACPPLVLHGCSNYDLHIAWFGIYVLDYK